MSGLTSSAVGGRKAAPRAPPRRRVAAPDATPSSLSTTTVEIEQSSNLETGGTEVPTHNTRTRRRVVSPPAAPTILEQDPNSSLATGDIRQPTGQTGLNTPDGSQNEAVRPRNSRKRASNSVDEADSTSVAATKRARVEPSSGAQSQQTARQRTATAKGSTSAPVNPRSTRAQPQAPTPPVTQASTGDSSQANQAKPRRKPRKAPKPAEVVTQDGDDSDEAAAADGPDSDENHEINPATLSMYDLSHDTKHGKTSEREKKMAKIDWAEVKRKRHEEAEAIIKGEVQPDKDGVNAIQSTEDVDGIAHDEEEQGEDGAAARPEPITRASGGGVRFRIVGGQLVEDESSLTIDRAARVAEAAAQSGDAVEEENDLTIRFNRTTYINARRRDPTERVPLWRSKSDVWSDEDTDRFYDALRMFGTDFFIISKMFPPRTRKQMKLKFVREERLEPDRINAALLGKHTRRIDLDEYAQAINKDVNDFHKYDSLDHANEVIRASMKDKEEAMRAAVKEDKENNRQRDAQRQQREKQRLEAEKKKEERAKKKAMGRRGDVWGAGTLGGATDDGNDFDDE